MVDRLNTRQHGKPTQISLRKREYRPFTRAAAVRVCKAVGIRGKEDVLFKLVSGMTETYERFRLTPDHQQRKQALEELHKAIWEVARVAARHERALENRLEITLLLGRLGELLTYEGIEKLLGRFVPRGAMFPEKAGWDDHDELTRLNRSSQAAQAGPKLLVALFNEMRSALDQPLARVQPSKGGRRIKRPFRHVVAMELATHWQLFFDERPTTAGTGDFAEFCLAVFDELECDTTGFNDTLPDIFDDAATIFAPFRGPRTRRKARSNK
jgi:hypothetical protein